MKKKKSSKSVFIRFTSLVLTLMLVLLCFPVTALGTDELPEQLPENPVEENEQTAFARGVGELSVASLEDMTLNQATLPDAVGTANAVSKDHVLRLYEQEEDLNTVIFQNRDGGKTVYYFANAVKYRDANGNIRDKSSKLSPGNVTVGSKTYAFSATDNTFGQYYPQLVTNGVLLSFGAFNVETTPVATGIMTLRDTSVINNQVIYSNVFGSGSKLVYTPTLSGMKEDIILEAYRGKSSFSFKLKTNGLAVMQNNGDTYLADPEGNNVASIGEVIVKDSSGNTALGSISVVANTPYEEYTLTLNAPVSFLTSNSTVYPVTVDPSIVINERYSVDGSSFSSAIKDVCIYTGGANPSSGTRSYLGNYYYETDTVYSSRMLYQLTPGGETYNELSLYIDSSRYYSASLNMRGSVNEVDVTVTAGLFGYYDWNNGTSLLVDDETYNSHSGSYTSTTTVSNAVEGNISINITEPLRRYSQYPSLYDCFNFYLAVNGEGDSSDDMCYNRLSVYQTEDELETRDVYITIDYDILDGDNYINNLLTGKFIKTSGNATIGYGLTQGTHVGNTNQKWRIEYAGANKYYIKSKINGSYGLCASGNNAIIGPILSSNDACKWEINEIGSYFIIMNSDTETYLKAHDSTLSLGNYSSSDTGFKWRLADVNSYVNLTGFSVSEVVYELGESGTYSITKNNSATWSDHNDFAFSNYNSCVINTKTRIITGGNKGVTNITVTHKPSGKTASLTVIIYQPAVFLIHGRSDNSFTVWGANAGIYVNPNDTEKKNNNHFNSNLYASNITEYGSVIMTYISTVAQRIDSYSYDSESIVHAVFNGTNAFNPNEAHEEGGNLAYYLENLSSNAYLHNVDLYVFNYPNKDAVIHNAYKFDMYLQNLAAEVRESGTKLQKASLFGRTTNITSSTPININIVGHSMGGLVARYYIENIGKDENVEKLITLGTPHWGSGLADAACITGAEHKLCDHDLRFDSRMYGGSFSNSLNCNAIGFNCTNSDYVLTDELNYSCERRTKYYAIAGLDYDAAMLISNDYSFEIATNLSTYSDIYNTLQDSTNNELYKRYTDESGNELVFTIDIFDVGDNTVGLLSQIGWTEEGNGSPDKRIDFEKIFINIDTNGGNNISDHFHGKMPHRTVVMSKVLEYLTD